MSTRLIRISGPDFVCGLVIDTTSGLVTQTAPMLHYMRSWREARARGYVTGRGWTWEELSTRKESADGPSADRYG